MADTFDEHLEELRATLRSLEERSAEQGRTLQRLREILDAAGEALVAADETGQILVANLEAERLLGWTREELIGEPLVTMIPPEDRDRHLAAFARYILTGERHLASWRGVPLHALTKAGNRLPVFVSYSEVRTPVGRVFTAILRERGPST